MNKREMAEDMKTLTKVSAIIGREIGVCICGNNELYFDTLTIGDEHSGVIMCNCNPVNTLFHTHITGENKPSKIDVESLVETDVNAHDYCIGAMKNGEPHVKCYSINRLKSNLTI